MKRGFITFGLIISVGLFGYYIFDKRTKQLNGYCFTEKRYLTNFEVVNTAVDEIIKNLTKELNSLTVYEREKRIHYSNQYDFYLSNPDCCGYNWRKLSKPHRPVKAWIKDKFIHNIHYQYKLNGEIQYRRVRTATSFCGDTSYVIPLSDNDIWKVGTDTDDKS